MSDPSCFLLKRNSRKVPLSTRGLLKYYLNDINAHLMSSMLNGKWRKIKHRSTSVCAHVRHSLIPLLLRNPVKKKPGSTRSIQRDIPRERAALVAGLRPSDRFRRDRLKQTSSISTKRLEDMLGPSWFKKPGDLVKSGLDAAKQIALKVSITSFFPSLFFTLILTSLNFILNSIQISG